MQQKEITIGGKTYPVVFTLKTMMNYEEITKGKSFFGETFDTFKSRIALIISAVFAADENADITVEQLTNAETWQEAQDIIKAYVAVMELSAKFFNIPEVEPKDEKPADETEEEGKAKN
jgi:hypothetical protein